MSHGILGFPNAEVGRGRFTIEIVGAEIASLAERSEVSVMSDSITLERKDC